MTDKQIILDGCEFQSNCIEYKDISYLKIMPICAIHELSIACHDKVNKCKYYKLYKQLQSKEQKCKELKKNYFSVMVSNCEKCKHLDLYIEYKQALQEIKDIADTEKCYNCKNINKECFECANDRLTKIFNKIKEVLDD